MKKFSLFALLLLLFVGCDKEPEYQTPKVTLSAVQTTETSLAFEINTDVAEKVAWICSTEAKTAEEVLNNGTETTTGANTIVVKELTPSTTYTIYAAAVNGTETSHLAKLEMTTREKVDVVPTVEVKVTEVASNSVRFQLTVDEAEKVAWICSTEAKTADDVLADGTEANVGTNDIVVEGLNPLTTYTIYAAARNGKAISELAKAQATTTQEVLPAPTISVTPGEATETTLSFTITSTNADFVHYVAVDDITHQLITVDADFVLGSNNIATPNTSEKVTIDYRVPATKYYIYAAARRGEEKVITEAITMTTLEPTYTTSELPTPDFCTAALTELASRDRYSFSISDEANTLYLTFDLYTEKGTNGAIPTATYTIGDDTAGSIDLNSITLVANGATLVVSSGELDVELYEDGTKVRLAGDFTLVDNNSVTLNYDGTIGITGTSTPGGDDSTINSTFTSISNLFTIDGTPGWYEIQFMTDDGAMLDLCLNSDPAKNYLTGGFYPVFANADDANQMAMGNSWITASPASFYQDKNGYPYDVRSGMDSYVQITTDMDIDGTTDNYNITFELKVKSLLNGENYTLKGTYSGALGFSPEAQLPTIEIATFYVDIQNSGSNYKLTFFGGFTDVAISFKADSLPEIGGDYVYYDIMGGTISDMYLGVTNLKIDGGRIAIKRYEDLADASDENKVKPYFAFRLDGVTAGGGAYRVIGDWTSFQQPK